MPAEVSKEASAGTDDRGSVPTRHLMVALGDFDPGLTAAEYFIWLGPQDLDGTGSISLGGLNQAITPVAAMKKRPGVSQFESFRMDVFKSCQEVLSRIYGAGAKQGPQVQYRVSVMSIRQ